MNRSMNRRAVLLTLGLCLGILVTQVALAFCSPKAEADQPPTCASQWGAKRFSWRAWSCRQQGWILAPHFSMDRGHRLWATDFKPCTYEDTNGCYWDAQARGNHYGLSFVRTVDGRVFYVKGWHR